MKIILHYKYVFMQATATLAIYRLSLTVIVKFDI
jgi:hypothetical protein